MSFIDSCVVSWLGLQEVGSGLLRMEAATTTSLDATSSCAISSRLTTTQPLRGACQEQAVDVKASILCFENRYFMRAGAPVSMRCHGPTTKEDPPKRIGSEAGFLPGRPRPLLRQ